MKIAIIGAGNIGRTLGQKWLQKSHDVVFGVQDRNSPKVQKLLAALGAHAKLMDISAALLHGEGVVLSLPWRAVEEVVAEHTAIIDGKIVMDPTNRFEGPVINNIANILKHVPNSRVYRVFNSLGYKLFAQPVVDGVPTDHFFTGPDGEDREIMTNLIQDIGLHPVWVGENDQAALVDHLGALWVTLVFQRGMGDRFSFRMVRHD